MNPEAIEPLLPRLPAALSDVARDLYTVSARLAHSLHPDTLQEVERLTRVTNSYYSNRIEGHSTHPVDIERAMREDWSTDAAKRDLQTEARAHMAVQSAIAERLADEGVSPMLAPDGLRWIHRLFYDALPQGFRTVSNKDGTRSLTVRPGHFREGPDEEVEVGRHLAPPTDTVPALVSRIADVFRPERFHGVDGLAVAGALHHRLMWIHPFLDGNGRVVRMVSDLWMYGIGLEGYGLWNVSRGLARRRDDYMAALANADSPRRGDLDGRGQLSLTALEDFCRLFLEVGLDQARYMGRMLALDAFPHRLMRYAHLRAEGMLPAPHPDSRPMRPEAGRILRALAVFGSMSRGDAQLESGLGERTARDLLGQLLDEGLALSDSPKGPVRLGIPATVAHHWFPDLYPAPID